jgi:hypothetical protein
MAVNRDQKTKSLCSACGCSPFVTDLLQGLPLCVLKPRIPDRKKGRRMHRMAWTDCRLVVVLEMGLGFIAEPKDPMYGCQTGTQCPALHAK